ncbi:hypothetical protein C3K47_11100 [Solitalea longa]|uniref:Macroglobulin domain-containing protein n=1 Tax=Solitalea longa TaxID=2079460 RepID=A0A2S5A165_9SPHI|nr:hypothetical protein [Solitalea longa]POY36295.1 hypothetical protein C3K47_11100 [Solitalea longa]
MIFITLHEIYLTSVKIKYLIITIVLFASVTALADDPIVDLFKLKVVKPYTQYFEQTRERVYVHTNRSEYFAGDNIWFKAYVYDALYAHPVNETSKLYVELFNPLGKLIERKILFVRNGVSNNSFHIEEDLEAGEYTLRAYTNWMRNFKDQSFYRQTIKVLNSDLQKKPILKNQKELPDVQVFPEGGSFVEGVKTRFGIKVTLPDGHGTQATGFIVNSKNDTLQTFLTNVFGLGDFTITSEGNDSCRIITQFGKGEQKEIGMPMPQKKGIGLAVNNLNESKLIVELSCNEATLSEVKDKPLCLLVHNNGNVYQCIYFNFNSTLNSCFLNPKLMGPGINYITVFNADAQPIAERLVFNKAINIKGSIDFKYQLANDSLLFEVSTADSSQKPAIANLSFSVLPAKTTGNKFKTSLYADVLLLYSLKGTVESPEYYLESNDYERRYQLDNLLLTQGWRRYNWQEITAGSTPKLRYAFESGFEINVKAINAFKNKAEAKSTFTLFSPENNLILAVEADSSGKASFKKLYLKDSSNVTINASNLEGKVKNRVIETQIVTQHLDSTIIVNSSRSFQTDSVILQNPFGGKTIKLKEVVVKAQKKKDPFEGNIFSTMDDRTITITKENYFLYNSLENLLLIEFNAFTARDGDGNLTINLGASTSGSPALIVDGFTENLTSYFDRARIEDIEAIAINRFNPKLGMNGSNGSINIITRKEPVDWWDSNNYSHLSTLLVKGYAAPVQFFQPKYVLKPETTDYQKYASVYWNPNVQTDSKGKATFKFMVPKEIKELIIRSEGISQNGTVYFVDRKINLDTDL